MMHDRMWFAATFLLVCIGASPTFAAEGRFQGTLGFHPEGCEKTRDCILKEEFYYIDSTGEGWKADAGNKTDGASIPGWAQSSIGQPFDPRFIRAAVIHDHYCDRNVKSWLRTHWVFYDALLTSGVSSRKAKLMYAAVLLGGPKWIWTTVGKGCNVGNYCINAEGLTVLAPGTILKTNSDGIKFIYKGADYDSPEFVATMSDISDRLDLDEKNVTREDIERIIGNSPQVSFFYRNSNGIHLQEVPVGVTE